MQYTVVVLVAFIAVVHGLNMDALKPYDLSALVMFYTEDVDQDGIFTRAELDADFSKYDVDGDGRMSRHEYTGYICFLTPDLYQVSHYLYDLYDMDGDHYLDKHDYDALYASFDADGDGGVVEAEWLSWWIPTFTRIEGYPTHQLAQSPEHGAVQCF